MRKGSHPLHPSLRVALILVATATMALLLNQCRMVQDLTTAPRGGGVTRSQPDNHGNCISQCALAFADSNRVEAALHESILLGCGDDATCVANENARYASVTARIAGDRKACFDECHHQGSGSGGR